LESSPEVKDERREMVHLIAAYQSDTTTRTSLYRDDYYHNTYFKITSVSKLHAKDVIQNG